MTEIIKRPEISDIYKIKLRFLDQFSRFSMLENDIRANLQLIASYEPFRVDYRFYSSGKDREIKFIDQKCWMYLIQYYELGKYMLCTEYNKMMTQIERFEFPEFNPENVEGWQAGLKGLIYDNVKTLVKQVYRSIIDGTYYTGSSSWNSKVQKKRNNMGIDKSFILTTQDYSRVFGYWNFSTPSITEDIEKVCYLLNGEKLPKVTLKDQMRSEKITETENPYMKVLVCKNGNTHYWLNEDVRNKLNLYGPEGNELGENIKIKVFER